MPLRRWSGRVFMDDQRASNRTRGTVEAKRKSVKKTAGGSDVLGRRGKRIEGRSLRVRRRGWLLAARWAAGACIADSGESSNRKSSRRGRRGQSRRVRGEVTFACCGTAGRTFALCYCKNWEKDADAGEAPRHRERTEDTSPAIKNRQGRRAIARRGGEARRPGRV